MNPLLNSSLSLRRRSVWEAADSGILLWRRNFVYFIPFMAIPVWVIACCIRLPLYNLNYLSYFILWWLKPLFDRLILHVISLRFFGSSPAFQAKELRRIPWRALLNGLPGDLLWRRFSPYRAAFMPIMVLERLGQKQFRQRKKTLLPGGLNFCFLISALGLAAEVMILLGEVLFVVMAVKLILPSAADYLLSIPETLEILVYAAFCVNYIIMESLYVCMGFGLYINSRVELEGWDLQILFQKFAGTGKSPKQPNRAIKAVLPAIL